MLATTSANPDNLEGIPYVKQAPLFQKACASVATDCFPEIKMHSTTQLG